MFLKWSDILYVSENNQKDCSYRRGLFYLWHKRTLSVYAKKRIYDSSFNAYK